jgi:hypothetical protein
MPFTLTEPEERWLSLGVAIRIIQTRAVLIRFLASSKHFFWTFLMPRKANTPTAPRSPDLEKQAAEIEGICRRTGLNDEEMARRLPGVASETFRKVRKGYQKASELLMSNIRAIERVQNVFGGGTARVAEEPGNKLVDELQFIVAHGSEDEVRLIERMISGAYDQVRERRQRTKKITYHTR